jgi:hypothetical protein
MDECGQSEGTTSAGNTLVLALYKSILHLDQNEFRPIASHRKQQLVLCHGPATVLSGGSRTKV